MQLPTAVQAAWDSFARWDDPTADHSNDGDLFASFVIAGHKAGIGIGSIDFRELVADRWPDVTEEIRDEAVLLFDDRYDFGTKVLSQIG